MKKSLLLIPFCLLFYTGSFAQQYAQWAKLKAGAPPMMREAVPASSEVGIPPYPGAVLISNGTMRVNKEQDIPFLNLAAAAAAEPPKVEEWYREQLLGKEGWKYGDMLQLFYKGEGTAMEAMGNGDPYVSIMELAAEAVDLFYVEDSVKKNLKTRIQNVYQPGGQ